MSVSPSFEKVGECLYRNPSSGTYYALVKVGGKQIKNSLKTPNLAEARRKLKDFRNDISRVDPGTRCIQGARLASGLSRSVSGKGHDLDL